MDLKFKFEVFAGNPSETLLLKVNQSVFIYAATQNKKSLVCLLHEMNLASFKEMLKVIKDRLQASDSELSFKIIGPKKCGDEIAHFLQSLNSTVLKQVIREHDFEVYYTVDDNKIILKKEDSTQLNVNHIDSSHDSLSNKPIKVMIVDDSPTIIQLLTVIFKKDKNLEIVATCEDPLHAEELYQKHKPDVITMDINMPHIDGVQLVKKLAPLYKVPIVMISSISQEEGPQVFNALENGAVDYIQKPTLQELDVMAPIIIERIKIASHISVEKKLRANLIKKKPMAAYTARQLDPQSLVVIGSSTGGTEALKILFAHLPKEIPPILVVQHIPPVFSTAFAKRLNELLPFEVVEARDGDELKKNCVYIAPGGMQMAIKRRGQYSKLIIKDDEPMNRHKPSVDYLFKSVVEQGFPKVIGVILTGMGADGARELLNLRKAGARTIAQNKDSCIVYGMPREAIERGAAEYVLPLEVIGEKIMELASVSSSKHKSA